MSVITGKLDPLLNSNRSLVHKLRGSDVDVEHCQVESAPHGFLTFPCFAADHAKVSNTLDWLQTRIDPLFADHLSAS